VVCGSLLTRAASRAIAGDICTRSSAGSKKLSPSTCTHAHSNTHKVKFTSAQAIDYIIDTPHTQHADG
jgi:hypothetical protein